MDRDAITIVSGLPRSGTSMMMKMLEAGGMPVLTDNTRTADEDNPQGYYEFEKVKRIECDSSWLELAKGKAVKMISALLEHLPRNYTYRIIFMHRNMDEIFRKHLGQVEAWIDKQPNIAVLDVQYHEVLKDPLTQAQRVNQFLGNVLNAEDMARMVDHSLYRQRHP